MDTKTTNDSFLWSLTDIENDCSLCSRQIVIGNGVPGVILPCCQQMVCEDCYKNELIKKSNGSCPFCFFKGEYKPQKASLTMSNIINANSQPNLTARTIPNGGSTSSANSLHTVGSGLPLDLSCWLPQNLTAICNPGYQSNSTTTCATSPYYKSNNISGDGFNQDNFIYMRGNPIPGVTCAVNSVNVGIGGQNMNVPSAQPQPFGAISDGFWSHSTNSTSINSSSNHNATGSSTTGSFISDPWMSSTGGYSPTNGFMHDFSGYENNSNNVNPNNISCKNSEHSNEDVPNINGVKTLKSNNGNINLISTKNAKFVNGNRINNMTGVNNNINNNNNSCDVVVVSNDYNKDGIYSSNININSFVQGTQGLNALTNNAITDIYNTNSMYTWTIQSPITCNGMDSFSQVNDQEDNVSSASVDMDFQRFCLGLGFDINNTQNPNTPDTHCKDVLLKDNIQVSQNFESNFNNGNSVDGDNFRSIQGLSNTSSSTLMDYSVDSNENVEDTYKSKIYDIENKMESIDLQYGLTKDNQSIDDNNLNGTSVICSGNNSGDSDNNNKNDSNGEDVNIDVNNNNDDNYINDSSDSSTTSHLDSIGNNVNGSQNNKNIVDNSHLFNNSAFPPLTSAIIKQLPSKDVLKASNITNSQSDGFVALVGQNLSGAVPGSNQNINNNNPIASSNPKLLTIKGTRTDVTKNIGSALSGNNGKQNIVSSVKVGTINNLGASTGNASYIDAVLHKGDTNTSTTSGAGGRSDNSASTNSSDLTNPSGEIPGNSVNTDEDSSISLGAHGEPYNYKRALCRHWMRGYCWLEADCKFAHGEAELRTRDGKLRHPTLSISVGSDSSRQNQLQTQFQSPTQVSSSATGSMGSTGGSSTTSTLTSTGAVVVSSNAHQKNTKQLSIKATGSASYAATAASSLTSSVLNSDSNISYSVMVVSGASNLDSKR